MNMEEKGYSFWNYDTHPSSDIVETVSDTIYTLRKLTNPTAVIPADKLVIDGKSIDMAIYKINGNNYFMLRGLAQALSGTNAQFDVVWDNSRQRISLVKGKPYTPVGNENSSGFPAKETAELTSDTVYRANKPLYLTAYKIHGNNFFKLRDLGTALNFNVDWDEATRTIFVTT